MQSHVSGPAVRGSAQQPAVTLPRLDTRLGDRADHDDEIHPVPDPGLVVREESATSIE